MGEIRTQKIQPEYCGRPIPTDRASAIILSRPRSTDLSPCRQSSVTVKRIFSPASSLGNVPPTRDTNNLLRVSIWSGVRWSEVREASWAYFRVYLACKDPRSVARKLSEKSLIGAGRNGL